MNRSGPLLWKGENGFVPLHHYLPAALLGQFSNSEEGPRRNRPVWCMRRDGSKPFRTTPANIGAVRDLYTMQQHSEPEMVDGIWTYYERRLPDAIDDLIQDARPLDASVWLKVLVPFVASLFVRGEEFNGRYESRAPSFPEKLAAAGYVSPDSTNFARTMELQRLLAPVTRAHWGVLRNVEGGVPFLINDLGLSVVEMPRHFESPRAWLIPLDKHHALTVAPRMSGAVMRHSGLGWKAIIDRLDVRDDDVLHINRDTAHFARSFLVAPTQALLHRYTHKWSNGFSTEMLNAGWGGTSAERRAHEFDWHRLTGLVSQPFSAHLDLQTINPDACGDWCPPLIIPAAQPNTRSGLRLQGTTMHLTVNRAQAPTRHVGARA